MWIFGYGSLTWKVDFPYCQRVVGYIKGYSRRFWQASIDHRGVPGKPGRVVTLIPSDDPEAKVWGIAYEIPPEEEQNVLTNLNIREQHFEHRRNLAMYSTTGEKLKNSVLVFLGTDKPGLMLGDASVAAIAEQIAKSHGPSGPNSEYLLKLAQFMRKEIPQASDDHLFELEAAVIELLGIEKKDK
ncbi:putative glutathione-specific gamma-glutamylcyclotransferase 2 [Macrobrachium rosenbergii]|uniref:putative glutathione-specific gamma-glutamylcyclotransferase 2 n=1 Tax=Macrobrachium rosenbergii TaxID=79674 RepID=UPI0034D44A82